MVTIKYYNGERLYFRPLEPGDEEPLRRWRNDPEIWRTLDRGYPVNEFREREYIEKLYKSTEDVALGIVVKEQHRLIGATGLRGMTGANRRASFGILIGDKEYQSHGFGTEATRLILRLAFEEYNLNRVELSVLADNTAAIRAYERAGFVREGVFRESYFRGGRYVDALQYAILRSEWLRAELEPAESADQVPRDRVA